MTLELPLLFMKPARIARPERTYLMKRPTWISMTATLIVRLARPDSTVPKQPKYVLTAPQESILRTMEMKMSDTPL